MGFKNSPGCGCCTPRCKRWGSCSVPREITISGADSSVTYFFNGDTCTNMGDLNDNWPIYLPEACEYAAFVVSCVAASGQSISAFINYSVWVDGTSYRQQINVGYQWSGSFFVFESHIYQNSWPLSGPCPTSGSATYIRTDGFGFDSTPPTVTFTI